MANSWAGANEPDSLILEDIEPIHVAAYNNIQGSAATIKQPTAAIRMMFSWLTEKGILAINPARVFMV